MCRDEAKIGVVVFEANSDSPFITRHSSEPGLSMEGFEPARGGIRVTMTNLMSSSLHVAYDRDKLGFDEH